MTGFGGATGMVGSLRVTVEIRTVNHRFFSPSIKLPAALSRWEGEVRERLRRRVARGHATVSARVDRDANDTATVDERMFAAYVSQLRDLQARYSLAETLDVATLLRLPNVLGADAAEDTGTAEECLLLVDMALDALTAMRDAEGRRLHRLLVERLDLVAAGQQRIALRAPERLGAERERLRLAVRELSDGLGLDEVRLAQEIALLADRLDVSEELDRFGAHVSAFRETLDGEGGQPVGKRLGFLLQEMLRETNTTGSKARDATMLHEVVAIKEELERIAEQVENLE
ncbi:MAG: YicC/YloC family endoribonuclease [Gemmatimonadaceae bacterium]